VSRPPRVAVVGAGLAGLLAARALRDAGRDVVLFDKGRSPGGRLATRRVGGARLDHGAQFFTTRSDRFASLVAAWMAAGLVYEWTRGFATDDGHPRYAVHGGMNALAKHLAAGLEVHTDTLVFTVRPRPSGGWAVGIDDGREYAVDEVIVTCPLPQAFSVLIASTIELPVDLRTTDYDRTLALLAVLDGPSGIPTPGGVQDADEVFSFVADNRAKGISDVSAVTLHARAEWSLAHWELDRDAAHARLREAATPWLGGASVVASQLKRWRFATPQGVWAEPCWRAPSPAPLVLAGDAFAGPRVEGAALSGLAAAAALLDSERLPRRSAGAG
jgi:predicted NAD/FAD-dependent oxidoreductase